MPVRLAYILAASHSGSTLLSMLLGSVPGITTAGELKFSAGAMGDLDRYRCSCGDPIRSCSFWQRVREGMRARGLEFDLACAGTDYGTIQSHYARRLVSPMVRGRFLEALRDISLGLSGSWRTHLEKTHKRNAALVSTVLEITGAQVVVDSSKVALRLKCLLRNPGLDVRVIRLIRDGRAVALTYMDPAHFADAEDPARRGGGMGDCRQRQRLSMAQAAYEWRRCMEEAESVLRGVPRSCWIEVRYEDYCTAPAAVLRRLQEFLEVDPDEGPRGFRTVEQHIVGNGMRLNATSEVRLDERWRGTLTEQDLRTFEDVTGAVNRRYGYV